MIDAVFRSQPRWGPEPVSAVLAEIAEAHGLSPRRYRACLADPKALAAFDARVRAGALADHVTATPTFFVNGRKVGEGEISLEALAAAIAEAKVGRRSQPRE